ncbi:MAG TPA: dihydrofolate reductase family protein [Longimicrobiales bacterium]|nr:dihydrofolate reductase family protein [Longimicrobiales bacterium]
MRKLIVAEFITLDGVIQAPGAPDEDPSGGFRFGGWVAPYDDDAIDRAVHDLFAQPFELLLGRRTYDIWAAYWPNVPAGHPIADRFNRVRKHVATHRPDALEWENSHALRGEPADAVRALQREGDGNFLTYGSGELVRQLLIAGLVDELRLMVFPIVLGRGKRLFGDDALASAFTLDQSERTPGGVLITRYLRAGEVRTGAIGARDAG